MSEPNFIDDASRVDINVYLNFLTTRCETLIGLEGDKVVAVGIFHVILPHRKAEFTGWVSPEYRQGFSNQKKVRQFMHEDAFWYAWERLKLIKLESRISVYNNSALCFAKNAGFNLVGTLRLDFLISGVPSDSVLIEKVNPVCFIEPIEEIIHGEPTRTRRERTSSINGLSGSKRIQLERTDRVSEPLFESAEPSEYRAVNGRLSADIFAAQ